MRSSEANKGHWSLAVNVTQGTYFAATLIQEYEDRFCKRQPAEVRYGDNRQNPFPVFSAGGNNA